MTLQNRVLEHVVPPRTPFNTRLPATVVDRLLDLDADKIRHLWDPLTCPVEDLPYLAWALSVDIWDADWIEDKKRTVIAAAFTDHQIKGTEALISRYVAYAGGDVLQVITRPQGLYLDSVNQQDIDRYLALLPEVRVYLGNNIGAPDNGLYLDADFLDDGGLAADRSPILYGRQSRLYQDGVETPLETTSETIVTTQLNSITSEQVSIPGLAGAALMLDEDFLDDQRYLDGAQVLTQFLTYVLDEGYLKDTAEFTRTYLVPSLRAQTPRWNRESNTGQAGQGFMLDSDYFNDNLYLIPDNSPYLIFDAMRLFDPNIQGPNGLGDGFLDDARLDMRPFEAEILVNADRKANQSELYLDIDYFEQEFFVNDNLSLPYAIMEAIIAGKTLSDRVLVGFDTSKTRTFGDPIALDGSVLFDQTVPRIL